MRVVFLIRDQRVDSCQLDVVPRVGSRVRLPNLRSGRFVETEYKVETLVWYPFGKGPKENSPVVHVVLDPWGVDLKNDI